jgi:hypothetical protein
MSTDGPPIELEGDHLVRHRDWVAQSRATRLTQRPALCCDCGAIRLTTAHGAVVDVPDGHRCLVTRKCDTCGTRTQHAYLMIDGKPDTDDRQPYPILDDATEASLLELEIEEARADGITVEELFIADQIAVNVTQYLDNGVWTILLNPQVDCKSRKLGLRAARAAIMQAGRHTWFVKPADPQGRCPPVRYALFGLPAPGR